MKSDPKPQRYKNEKYLNMMVRGTICGISGCGKLGEPHHVRRLYWGAGTSQKPHDYVTVSRCRDHHDPEFEENVGQEIINNLVVYLERVDPACDANRVIIDHLINCIEDRRQ